MDDVKQIQTELLKIFQIFSDVCEKKNLRYYGCGGTALGAVRHAGFIPWDDDLDIALPREDYEKLFTDSFKALLPEGIKMIDGEEMLYSRFENQLVLCDRGDRLVSEKLPYLYIDVFPIDGLPRNAFLKMIHFYRVMWSFFVIKLKNLDEIQRTEATKNRKNRSFVEKIIIRYGQILAMLFSWTDKRKIVDNYNRLCRKYAYDDADKVCVFSGRYRAKEIIDKNIIGKGKTLQFENTKINVYEKVEIYLEQIYGKEFMIVPDDDNREKHGKLKVVVACKESSNEI